jgi:hypothetical protein
MISTIIAAMTPPAMAATTRTGRRDVVDAGMGAGETGVEGPGVLRPRFALWQQRIAARARGPGATGVVASGSRLGEAARPQEKATGMKLTQMAETAVNLRAAS